MKENRDYLEMAWRSIECFSNDGTLRVDELQRLLDIALKDGVVDDNEKRILRSIVGKLNPAELTTQMQARLAEVRRHVGI
jgi:DnaJ-domain-containing protein 1